uniref:Uncharacterized protein n=1 Tax=Branchiostoma floridae TaxID=7739 RepID=C3Z562_BRAFL|eukprot:XP_002596407.1 hypothetical protein BRAFLDRAFT_76224 [Branchiostoma floridae]
MPKSGKEKRFGVTRTQGAAKSAQRDALHREERESRTEQQFDFLLPPGTTLPLPQRVEEETRRALSARAHDKAVLSKRPVTQKRRDGRKRPYGSSWRAGDGEFTDDDRSPSRDRQGQDRHGSAQLKTCQQSTSYAAYKTAVSKRTSTTKRRDRRSQPYDTSWLSGDESEQDDEEDYRSSSRGRPRASHHEKSSRIASFTPTAPHAPAVPSREEKRRLSPPPPVVLTLRRVAPSPHHKAKEAAGASKEYVVVQRSESTNSKVCHDDTGSIKRPCSTLEDSDESRRQDAKGSKRRISYQEYMNRCRSGDSRNVTASATSVQTGTEVPDETEKSPTSDRRVIKARRRMSQHELAEVTSQIRARKEALCPLITEKKMTDPTSRPTSSQPELAHSSATRCCGSADLSAAAQTQEETPAVSTDGKNPGVRHGRDVITQKSTSSKSSIGKSLIEFIKREEEKIRRDQKLRKLFRKKAAALAAKIGGRGASRSSGPPASAALQEKSAGSGYSKRGDGRLWHSLGQSEMPPSDQETDSRLPVQQYPLQPSNISQMSQIGGNVQGFLAATAVAASSQNVSHGVRTDNPRDNRLRDIVPDGVRTDNPRDNRLRDIVPDGVRTDNPRNNRLRDIVLDGVRTDNPRNNRLRDIVPDGVRTDNPRDNRLRDIVPDGVRTDNPRDNRLRDIVPDGVRTDSQTGHSSAHRYMTSSRPDQFPPSDVRQSRAEPHPKRPDGRLHGYKRQPGTTSDVRRPADENAHRRRRAPRSSTQTPLRSMPIQAVYTAKEIEQGIRSIRNADAEIPSSHEQRLAAVPAPRLSNPALLTSLPTPRLSNPALLTSLPTSRLSNPPLLTSLPSLRLANPPILTSLPTPRLSNPPLLTSLPTPRLSNPPLLTSLPTPRLSNPALLTSLRKPWPSNPPPLSSLPTPQQVLQFMRQQRASTYGEAAARQESGNVQQQTSLPMPMTSPLTIQGLQKRNNNQLQAGLNDRPPPGEPPIAVGSATAWMPIQGYPSMGREAAVRQESSDARQQASLSTPKASPFTTRQKKKESNNNQPQAGQKGKPRKPPVAVKAGKTDNLGPATASTGRSSTRTAMAVPLMVPPSDMNNNTITAPATPALPAVLPDRIPLEDAIRLLVGTESKDDPSRHVHVDSPMATTAGSSTSAFPKKQGQSSPATSTGKMGQSNGSSSLNLLPTSQPTRFGDKRPKKRACIGTDTNTGKRFKPQSNLASMYNTCEPVDISDTSYNVKEDDGVDGYETPWNFGVTPNLSLSRSEGGLWHSCKPVKSLSRPPPLPPLYRPRPPGLEHVQDSPPPTSPGSPRHPSYPLRYGATGRRKPMNHYLTPYHRVGVLEHPGSPLQSTSTCPDHMVARYQNYLWIEPYDWTDSGLCDMVDASVDSAVPNKQEEGQHNDDAMDIC